MLRRSPDYDLSHPIDISESSGVRYLHFGSDWVQGAMRIRRPYDLELAYTREMMAGLLLRGDGEACPEPAGGWPRSVLQIGLGAASLTRWLHHHVPGAKLTVVEINPRVVAMAEHMFKLPEESERLEIVIADGADFIAEATRAWDWILVDGFDPDARTGRLGDETFFAACMKRLTRRGLLTVNLLGRNRGFMGSMERLRNASAGRSVVFPSCDSGNAVAFAASGDPVAEPLADLRQRAQSLKTATGLDLLPTLSRLEQSGSLVGDALVF